MSRPILEAVSSLYEGTSKIIDAISNANYVFLEASVGFCIQLWGDGFTENLAYDGRFESVRLPARTVIPSKSIAAS